jgi:hypothetical protein
MVGWDQQACMALRQELIQVVMDFFEAVEAGKSAVEISVL